VTFPSTYTSKQAVRFVVQLLSIFILAVQVYAQAPEVHPMRSQDVTGGGGSYASLRSAAIQKRMRYLGRKFAARSGQDLSGTLPKTPTKELMTTSSSPRPLSLPGLGNPLSFANAGFKERGGLPAGYIPTAVAEGDFNEDGHMDVAVSNGGDNTVYVFLGKGDGTFQVPEILYTRGQSPDWIAAVKLRSNGHLDLAVTDGDSNSLEIFTGNGDGTFGPGAQLALSQTPTFVLAGDINKDGNADLVIGLTIDTGAQQPQFQVVLGDGSGGFSGSVFPPAILGSPDGPVPTGWIASGDVNKDGYLDLVTTVTGGAAITYLNRAGTGFSVGTPFGPNDVAMVVELGDMDEDGCPDAVELGSYGYVTIAKGSCDGNFTQGTFIAEAGDLEPAVKVVDVNGDAHLDVVGSAAYYNVGGVGYGAVGGYLVSVLKGDGKGNLAQAQIYRGGMNAFSLVVADFTGDQKPEILTADAFENRLSLFLNDGNGNYGDPQGEAIGYLKGVINAPNPTSKPEVVDLNGDGKPDILLVEDGTDSTQPSQLTVMLNDGTGKFLPPIRSPITVGSTIPYPKFATGAFRSAGKLDLIYLTMYQAPFLVAFFPGNGDGTFGVPTTVATLPNPAEVVVGDFNGDGKLDFAVYGGDGTGPGLEVDVFLGAGDGTFRHLPPQTFANPSTGGSQQIFALDLNNDGKLDLLIGNNLNSGWTNSGDDLVELLGNGDGTFQPAKILIAHFGAVAIADLNRDGFPDLIQGRDPTEDVGKAIFGTPAVTVYLGTASGAFLQQPTYTLPGAVLPSFDPVLVGDFNGDGIPDIGVRYLREALSGEAEARIRVLQGVGDGTFVVTGHAHQLQAYSYPFVGGDFNGDGATDLVELVGNTSSFHIIPAAAAPSLDIVFDAAPLIGATGTATVTLEMPAATAEVVTLSGSDTAVQLPGSLQFAAGQQVQNFSFTLGTSLDNSHVLALHATLGAETAIAYAAKPNPNRKVGVAAGLSQGFYPLINNQVSVEPGESFVLNFGVSSEGGYYGTFSGLQCMNLPTGAACSFDQNSLVVNAGGSAQVSFAVSTSSATPFGTYNVQIMATDGQVVAVTSLKLGIGDFSLQINPATIIVGPGGSGDPLVTSTSTNGLNEFISLTCSGLPANAGCGQNGILSTQGGSTGLSVGGGPLAAADYPFQITGTTKVIAHAINAVLRVGDFTASLDKTSATLTPGQSAVFNVTLTSVNHYASNITVFCSSPSTSLSCTQSPSPAALVDGGAMTVQLTVTASARAVVTGSPRLDHRLAIGAAYFACALVCVPLLIRRRPNFVFFLAIVVILVSSTGCGGGGGSASTSPPIIPPPPPVPTAQTITIPVVASAQSTPSDFLNQKTIGPIVITLQ
jgi:FG-GAP-like repeat